MSKTISIFLIAICSQANAQIPFEIFVGSKKTTIDIMFFKFFKNNQGEKTRWLFFNRNRANVDYRMTETNYLPQFGFTEAISYNHEKLNGIAPVLVGQVLSREVSTKIGVQNAIITKKLTIFTWLVCETLEKPVLDYFLLLRYTPELSDNINLFTQIESVNTFPTFRTENFSFSQRLRLGIQFKSYQFGAGADFNQTGNNTFTKIYNAGGFFRHEF